MSVVADPSGIPDEVDGGQVGRHAATARTPTRIEVGLIQLSTGSPASPPAGTRPEAMPPATAPMQYGTRTEDECESRAEDAAVAERDHGLAEREARAAQDDAQRGEGQRHEQGQHDRGVGLGNAVQVTTKMKISQTWLASHTGPIERSITRAWALAPRRVRRRSGPRSPAPKSAPPNTAYATTASSRTTATAVAHRTASLVGLGRRRRVGALGPVRAVVSTNPPARRKRRLMPRSTRIVVMPRAT